ncbi:unnamed protein product [Mytilus edulis]|uniref:Uncharacterized protein n=1 Tax=Mytilus edulis TaxID=6550 RepID=A0A8S3TE14_MYTED|nr:unnamed protein product [Mytilus edulis]
MEGPANKRELEKKEDEFKTTLHQELEISMSSSDFKQELLRLGHVLDRYEEDLNIFNQQPKKRRSRRKKKPYCYYKCSRLRNKAVPGEDDLEQEKNYQYGDKVCERRIDETLIQQEISGKTMDKFMILICGTRSFDEDIMKCCDNLGFNQKQMFKF